MGIVYRTLCACLAVCFSASMVSASTVLEMRLTGPIGGPSAGYNGAPVQTGPSEFGAYPTSFGKFESYSAASFLPQVTGNDLDKYGWAYEGQMNTTAAANVLQYTGTAYLLAPGYGFDTKAKALETGVLTMFVTFAPGWLSGTVAGTFIPEAGTRQPAGWPNAVDWSSAGIGNVIGTWSSTAGLDVTVTAVPLPAAAWAGMALLGGLGVVRRFRRTPAAA
jgi:hypothetical protein